MEKDEEGTALRIRALRREVVEPTLSAHQGRLVKATGDGFLAEFASPVEAVRCALAVQDKIAGQPANGGMKLRIGINLGDIIIEDDGDVLGDGVNVAARLEQIADPGGVLISGKIYEEIEGKIDRVFESRGEQEVKNLARPVRVYALAGAKSPKAEPKPLPLPGKPSIVVLPFTNMSGDPEQEYFADGIVEDIITALSRVRFLFVIARNSSFIYKGKTVDVRQVGRELGVRYVLEGSVRKAGNKIRITGQLIDCETGRHLWADKLDGDLEDIFALQDRVTRMVLGAIEPSLRLAEMDRVRAKPTADLGAYELYLRALYALNTYDEQSLHEADNLLRAALNRDPNYADAWAVLATTAFFRKVGGFLRHEEARTLGIEAAHRAVQADPENPLALASAAATLCIFGSDYEQALEFADRALSLAPSSSQVLTFCAVAYNFTGQPEKALPLLYEARRLSPRDPRGFTLLHQIAMAHFFSRRFDQAIEWTQRNVTQHPNFTPSRRLMISALAHSGRLDEARDAVRALLEVQPNANVSLVRTIAWQHPWMVALVVDGLRRAGLPE